jgi:uncharacterized membrane protein
MSYAAGCFVVLLMVACGAVAFGWVVWKALEWLAVRGVEPGAAVFVAVAVFAVYVLVQEKRNRRR